MRLATIRTAAGTARDWQHRTRQWLQERLFAER
jgi:hypothetical protein